MIIKLYNKLFILQIHNMLILQLHTVDPTLDIKKLQDFVSRIHNSQLTKSLQNLQHTTQISAHIDLFIIQMYKNKIELS